MTEFQDKYLVEVSQRLKREGFTVCPEQAGLTPVKKDGRQLCNVLVRGGIACDPDHVRGSELEDAVEKVQDIVRETMMYMRQMAAAPPLQAEGLSGEYRLLAEFNNTVLAGHERSGGYGVEFITWERVQGGTGLWQGNYYENDYAVAKQDFVIRSGLINGDHLFSQEQMTAVYSSIQETLDSGATLSREQEELLVEVRGKIQHGVPDLEERLSRMEPPSHGETMTQSWYSHHS